MSTSDMEAVLAKIRPHTASSLSHQKAPAKILTALEATFNEQKADKTPAAYFAGLLTLFDSTVAQEKNTGLKFGDGDRLPAELYLLALICPFVPAPIIRANLNTLMALTEPLWSPINSHAPALRSLLTLYNSVLRALDRVQLEKQTVRQSFATVLQFCVDPRPKVRKRAADIVRDVLASPPSPLLRHPYAERVGEWSVNALSEVNNIGSNKQKGKVNLGDVNGTAIHLITFIRPVLSYLPSSALPTITTSLLTLPRLGDPYLSQAAYGALSDLLSVPDDPDVPRNINASTSDLLQAILNSPPLKTDAILLPPWLQVVGKTMLVYFEVDEDLCNSELLRVWKIVFQYLESNESVVRRETAASLVRLTQCISKTSIDSTFTGGTSDLGQIINQISKAVDSLAFARAIPELLVVISSLIENLRYRPGGRSAPTAAEILLKPILQHIGELRVRKGFEHKESADSVLRSAMSVLGPEVLLDILPLNLMPEDREAGREPRAFLLPLLVQNHPSPLKHFITYFVPLTERMFDLQQKADAEGRAAEAKLWSVLVSQIWSGLPAYCYQTPDLKESLNPQFAQMLSQLLYVQPELRPPVLKALKTVVESNIKNDDEGTLTDEDIAQNTAFLRTQAESWFAVLFNVFGSVGRESQSMVGEVISAWASVSGEKEMAKTCNKVIGMLKTNISKMPASSASGATAHINEEQRSVVAAMQDILVLLVPCMSAKDAQTVFDLCLTPEVLTNRDNGVQKRAYKLLGKITQTGRVNLNVESLYMKMDDIAERTLSAAKKDRLMFLKSLLTSLPNDSLHVIPSLIPEAVLGTKEPSEKARSAAFELIVALGYKMKEGGIVKRAKLSGMDEDDVTEAPANLQEYFTMMAGGLAGASSHMISATILAITRLIFEFSNDISREMLTEIFLTFLEYLKSANREIVKSTLGFVKLFIHSQPPDALLPHLDQIVSVLLRWSHDHKNHFKEKVRHIFERLIRRCGWESVYAAAGEGVDEEAAKVLINIKKRKERAKRKKAAQRADEEDSDGEGQARPTTGDAFEDVLYGSESEEDDSDGEQPHAKQNTTKRQAKNKEKGARLRVDDDEPMDLLQGANTRIINTKAGGGRKPGAEAAKFKTDEASGKMLIGSSSDEDEDAEPNTESRLAGSAFQETLTSTDGFTRDSRGRVKFNKDTKKRRREADDLGENEDVEMADGTNGFESEKNKKARRQKAVKIGQEFKARRAGGDVKKGGVDPYAYLPLSQAAKGGRGKKNQKVSVTGRR